MAKRILRVQQVDSLGACAYVSAPMPPLPPMARSISRKASSTKRTASGTRPPSSSRWRSPKSLQTSSTSFIFSARW